MNIKKWITVGLSVTVAMLQWAVNAEIKVLDVEVFSGHPWKEVVVGYTITGTDTEIDADLDVIQLEATDKSANKTYRAWSLTGAMLTEGRHVLRWDAASDGAKFSSSNVVFFVSIVHPGVRLWEDGPYWAECNVGALKPEEFGYYFWWGDTVGHKQNAHSLSGCTTYRMSNSDLRSAGYIDSTGNLVAAYDAATAHLGAPWRMPTDAEFSALIANCTTTWTTRNGVAGLLVTGKAAYASKSIFLPAAGRDLYSTFIDLGSYGYYWSSSPNSPSSPNSSSVNCARSLIFNSGGFYCGDDGRGVGHPVRPVRGFAK